MSMPFIVHLEETLALNFFLYFPVFYEKIFDVDCFIFQLKQFLQIDLLFMNTRTM